MQGWRVWINEFLLADKVISLLWVTLVPSLAIVRTRRLRVCSVSEGGVVEDLSRFFAPEIARHITVSAHLIGPGEGVLCDAAIRSCDLRGFTKCAMQMPGGMVMKFSPNMNSPACR